MLRSKIMKLNSSIPICIDDTTFATEYPITAKEKRKLDLAVETERKCVLGCKRFTSLRYVPKNEASREEWRRKLNLTVLRRRDAVCDNHFENGEIISYTESNKEENEIDLELKHNRLSQNRSFPTSTTTQSLPKTWEYEEPKRKTKCILGCTDGATLHRVPEEPYIRMLWRDKLKLKDLKISHRVCANHFSHRNKKRIPSQALPNSPPRVVEKSSDGNLLGDTKRVVADSSEKNYGNSFGKEVVKLATDDTTDPNAAHQVLLKCKSTVARQRLLMKKCILGCTDFKTLHNVPKDDHTRNLWRKKLNLKRLYVEHKVCNNHFKSKNVKYIRSRAMPDSPVPEKEDKQTNCLKNDNKNNNTYESLIADILNEPDNNTENNNNSDNLVMEVLEDSELSKNEHEINNANNIIDSFDVEILDDIESEINQPGINKKNNGNEEGSIVYTVDDPESDTYEHEYDMLDMEVLEEPESTLCEIKTQDNVNKSSSIDILENISENKINDGLSVEMLEDEIKDTGNTSISIQILETSPLPQFPPSRSNALKSWLKTEDFCITTTNKKFKNRIPRRH